MKRVGDTMKDKLKGFKKGDQGILYKATISPWKVKRGGTSLIRFHLYNPKDKVMAPEIFIHKIEKKGLIGSSEFSPKSTKPDKFWIPRGISVDKMEKDEEAVALIPIFVNETTSSGDYKIFTDVKVPKEGINAGDVAKTMGKIAMALTVGYYRTKQFLPLKVLKETTNASDQKNAVTSLVGVKINNYGPYYPEGILLNYRRLLMLSTNPEAGIIKIYTQKAETDEIKEKLLSVYKRIIKDPIEVSNIEINGITYELRHNRPSEKSGSTHVLNATGYSEDAKRVINILGICVDEVYQTTLDVLKSIEITAT